MYELGALVIGEQVVIGQTGPIDFARQHQGISRKRLHQVEFGQRKGLGIIRRGHGGIKVGRQ